MFGSDQDDTVLVPYTTAMKRFAGVTTLRSINVQAATAGQMAEVQSGITDLLRQRHRIQPGADDDFMLRNQQELSEAMTATTEVMTALLAAIASVSLLVGGIGIMNIMLVSVTERTREIGIRLAIGALEHEVLLQFLIEAVVLSALGGLVGIVLAFFACLGLSTLMSMPFLFNPSINLIALAFSAAIGVIFGFMPARRAARLDPIVALRFE